MYLLCPCVSKKISMLLFTHYKYALLWSFKRNNTSKFKMSPRQYKLFNKKNN